jgi:transposase
MDRISRADILNIERDISQRVVSLFDVDLSCLLFDATNFFTFMDTFNGRSRLAQRGHSKEGRDSLRILGLALLVTADGEVPLLHHIYAGNKADSTVFSRISGELQRRCSELGRGVCDITLVFDKGNNSHKNLNRLQKAPFHFVGSLVPTQYPVLLAIGKDQMRRLDPAKLLEVWAHRTEQLVFGVKRTVLVTYNRRFYRAQLRTLLREINKRKRQLQELQDALAKHHRSSGNKPTVQGTQNKIDRILMARHMKDLFSVKLSSTQILKLSWKFNTVQWTHLKKTLLGKTLLFTDRSDWSDEQIILAYRSQYHVEAAFRTMKNPRFLSFRPINHWTDQKLRVHAFYCILALLILTLIRRQLEKRNIQMSIQRILERLSEVREIVSLYKSANEKRQRIVPLISRCDEEQQRIIDALELTKYFPR